MRLSVQPKTTPRTACSGVSSWAGGGGGEGGGLLSPPGFGGSGAGFFANVAVTARASLIVTVQSLVPEQPAPLQPLKVEPSAADACSVTSLPESNCAEQLDPQSTP